jgi:hypothetical protein
VTAALAFARGEALRTRVPHGMRVQGNRRITVFRLDRSVTPPAERYDVRDPVSKALYDVDVLSGGFTRGTIAGGWFVFQGESAGESAVSFDENGEPMRGDDALPLATGGVLLSYEAFQIAITLVPFTGRATIGQVRAPYGNPVAAFPVAVEP